MSLEDPYEKFDHPCKGTCSGWQQGFEKGQKAFQNFKVGDRVECYGTDDATKWFATGQQNPYRLTGTIIRAGLQHSLFKVEIDNSGSQDSEGYNAVLLYHEKQLRRLL